MGRLFEGSGKAFFTDWALSPFFFRGSLVPQQAYCIQKESSSALEEVLKMSGHTWAPEHRPSQTPPFDLRLLCKSPLTIFILFILSHYFVICS